MTFFPRLLPVVLLAAVIPALAVAQTAGAKSTGSDKFEVTRQQLSLGNLNVKLFQVKKRNPDGEQPRYCRASVEAWKGDNLFKRFDYGDIDPRDGAFGLFVPEQQPSSKYLVVVKEGDGDPRVLLFSPDGDFVDMPGGYFFASADRRYLITQTTTHGGSVSVFDFLRGELLLDSAEVQPIFSWHAGGPGGGYFFTETNPAGGDKPTERTDSAYALYFHPAAIKQVKLFGPDAKSPKVKLDFDPRKFPDCTSSSQ